MKNIKNVIGANYGDEGKGLLTRYFAINENNPIVILYHGSVNRGSLVEKEHVFCYPISSFGTGILDNIPTFYANNFIISPIRFATEYNDLLDWKLPLGQVYVDKNCNVITPVDIIIDRIRLIYLKEQGIPASSCCAGNRSCSMRIKNKNLIFSYEDFLNGDPIEICNYIFDNWFFEALKQLNIQKIPDRFLKYTTRNKGIIDGFYEQFICFEKSLKFFQKHTVINNFNSIYDDFDTLIFESSVGLKMSMENQEQINRTCSTVGLAGVMDLLQNYDDYYGEACYVTRSYLTKHGGGKFPEEDTSLSFEDRINNETEWQGKVRFGKLNYDEYLTRCEHDFYKNANKNWKLTRAITHINEVAVEKDYEKYFNYFSSTKFAEDIYVNGNTNNDTI